MYKSLYKAEVTKNLNHIREITFNVPWMIVSGGDQKELRKFLRIKISIDILMEEFLKS